MKPALSLESESPNVLNAPQDSVRVLMAVKDQVRFVRTVKRKCEFTWEDIGKFCGVKGLTAKVNYSIKGRTLPFKGASCLSSVSGIPLPPHKLVPANWGRIKGGERTRRKFYLRNPQHSRELAELLGILMGDGCIFKSRSKRTQKDAYFILVTGHSRELDYYEATVRPAFVKLFGVRGYLHERRGQNTLRFLIKSKRIYEYFKLAGLPEGKKNKSEAFLIPKWVASNMNFTRACVRGLTDTDGAIIRSHGRWINIQYKFASKSLIQSLRN